MAYHLKGRLLEVCDCDILCPCWVGEDPDNGTCDAVIAWQIDGGHINDVDVTGLTVALVSHLPGNVLEGNIKALFYLPEETTAEQEAVLVGAWTGQYGGALADLAQLIGEVIEVRRAPITFTVQEGKGALQIGDVAEAEMAPFQGPTGETTTLVGSVFSTIPGSPAWVAKASKYRRTPPGDSLRALDLQGRNAIQGTFQLEG